MDQAGSDSWTRWAFPPLSCVLVGKKAPEGHIGFYLIILPPLNNREQPGNLNTEKKLFWCGKLFDIILKYLKDTACWFGNPVNNLILFDRISLGQLFSKWINIFWLKQSTLHFGGHNSLHHIFHVILHSRGCQNNKMEQLELDNAIRIISKYFSKSFCSCFSTWSVYISLLRKGNNDSKRSNHLIFKKILLEAASNSWPHYNPKHLIYTKHFNFRKASLKPQGEREHISWCLTAIL